MHMHMSSTWGLRPRTPTPSAGPDFYESPRFIILDHPPGSRAGCQFSLYSPTPMPRHHPAGGTHPGTFLQAATFFSQMYNEKIFKDSMAPEP